MDDSGIIALYWQRSESAIEQTALRYGGRLCQLAHKILSDREDSEECVSDTYYKAWQTIPPQKPTYFYAYLAKICRHLAFGILDRRQAAKRQADVVSLSAELEMCIPDNRREAQLESSQIAQALTAFLKAQDPESRLIFLRRYWFAESVEEIALRYGITQSKVKTRLHRTRCKLRDYLEKEGIAL